MPARIPVGYCGVSTKSAFVCSTGARGLFPRRVDLIEDAPVFEVSLLRLLPASKKFVDGEELHLGKTIRILSRDFNRARAIEVPCTDLLSILREQELKIRLGHIGGPVFSRDGVHQA